MSSDCRLFNKDLYIVNENTNKFELIGANIHFIHNYYKIFYFYCWEFAGINTVKYFTAQTMDNVKCTSSQHLKNIYNYTHTHKGKTVHRPCGYLV